MRQVLLLAALLLMPGVAHALSPRPISPDGLIEAADRLRNAEATPRLLVDPLNPLAPLSWAAELGVLSGADVVLIGEHHDDPGTHKIEADIADSLSTIRAIRELPTCFALEMFERDVQVSLNERAEHSDWYRSPAFLKDTRAWPNYVSDYWVSVIRLWGNNMSLEGSRSSIFASNAPTAISRRVAKEGLEAVLPTLSAEERGWIAETTTAPKDKYWQRFLEAMGGGASADAHSSGMSEETLYRYYQAQCLKDDTMAETIARLREADPQRQVVHLSGSFHIDYGLGIVPRLKQRRPQDKIITVVLRPVADFAEATLKAVLDAEPGVADYVVFVLKEEKVAGTP